MTTTGKTGESGAAEGVVQIRRLAQGSKSDHETPVIVTDDGLVRVHVVGDNPFGQNALRDFVGQRVRVNGTWRAGVLRVPRDAIEVQQSGASSDDEKPSNHAE